MTPRATIILQSRLTDLERLAAFVDQFGEQNGVGARDLFAVKLALDEVVTNGIRYAHDDAGDHEIVVRLVREGGEVVAEVEDEGRPFDPLQAGAPDLAAPLEQRPVGGLGIHLARQMTDRLEYRRQGDHNVLRFRRTLGGE